MTVFHISAPGRVTLCGEHTVMYGKQVVAASLDIRTSLHFLKLPLEKKVVKIELPKVDISLKIPLEKITGVITDVSFNLVIDHYPAFFNHVQYFITENCLWTTFEQKFSLKIFFFLLYVIAHKEGLDIQPFHVHLTTKLKMNAGLGSSTSFATCLAACFFHWSCLERGDRNGFTPEKLERISAYVESFEKLLGQYKQDHIICTYGHVTAFQYRDPLNVQSEVIKAPEMSILLVDANICLDKNQQMQQLADMRNRNDKALNDYLNDINAISEKIVQIFRRIRDHGKKKDLGLLRSLYACLNDNLSRNQDLIRDLNLSHSYFNTICSTAESFGFKGKLTGDGASKVIILLPQNYYYSTHYQKQFIEFTEKLKKDGFAFEVTSISCTGVQLYPILKSHKNN